MSIVGTRRQHSKLPNYHWRRVVLCLLCLPFNDFWEAARRWNICQWEVERNRTRKDLDRWRETLSGWTELHSCTVWLHTPIPLGAETTSPLFFSPTLLHSLIGFVSTQIPLCTSILVDAGQTQWSFRLVSGLHAHKHRLGPQCIQISPVWMYVWEWTLG